jgi:hypothetical protein
MLALPALLRKHANQLPTRRAPVMLGSSCRCSSRSSSRERPLDLRIERLVITLVRKRRRNMTAWIVEIRAAEGGADAKALVKDQLGIYLKVAMRREL